MPTPTITATGAANPCGANSGVRTPCSVYSVNSNPSGLTVLLDGQTVGTTPVNVTPLPSYNPAIGQAGPNQITVQPGNGGANYTVVFNQTRNGNHQVFYNRVVDTQGSISNAYSSVIRAQSLAQTAPFETVRRPPLTNARERPSIDPQHLFVKYQLSALQMGGRTARDVENVERLPGGNDVITTDGVLTRVVPIPAGSTFESLSAKLARHAEVVKTSHVHLRYLMGAPFVPNDTHFQLQNQQWDMFQIQMPQAWSYTQGNGVTIADLDTGYDSTSKDFSKVSTALTFLGGGNPTSGAPDNDGHGSNTGGIAAAVTNNGFGFAGVGFNANLMVLKIIDNNGGINTADEANAVQYAANNGARVINLSIGGPQVDSSGNNGYDDTEAAAIAYAIAHNVVVVAAAGNESGPYTPNRPPVCNTSQPACGVTSLDYPGAYPGVIAVGASACLDNGTSCTTEYVASYSNGGPGLGIVAPGGDPTGGSDPDNFHWIDNLSSPNGSPKCNTSQQPDGVCSGQFAGTSQATPHVAGAAALILALNPSMTPAQVAQLLYDTTDAIPGVDPSYQGKGRLNVARALAKLTGDSTYPAYRPAQSQFVAFAYTNSGATNAAPAIIDMFYTGGVPVNADGTFRIADINPSGAYKIGVWYDANGNGIVDAGDYFGASGACSTSSPCSASGIVPVKLGSNVIP
ncbi:MAG: S8 family serine peptidase [Candidatus Eremiobacteraeota bacterium]|nr:S8 family serine peptidase [Candidatus Eremiobacteraeota bacterium]